MGNICRSPAAQAILQYRVDQQHLTEQYFIDSAGTSAHFQGAAADPRMQQHAEKRGYTLSSISRQFSVEDFDAFDLIIPMDDDNFFQLTYLDNRDQYTQKIKPLISFLPLNHHFPLQVPDPYLNGAQGFEEVLDMLQAACPYILKSLQS